MPYINDYPQVGLGKVCVGSLKSVGVDEISGTLQLDKSYLGSYSYYIAII